MHINSDKVQNVIDSMNMFVDGDWRFGGDIVDDGKVFLCWVLDNDVVYCISCTGSPLVWEAMNVSECGHNSGVLNTHLTDALNL